MRFQQIDETVYLLDFHFFCRKMLWSFQQVREKTELSGPHFKVDTSVIPLTSYNFLYKQPALNI